MKKYVLFLIFFSTVFLSGCASSIKYGLDNSIYRSKTKTNYSVVIDKFPDKRETFEKSGNLNLGEGYLYTSDKNFKSGIEDQISQMLVAHLTKTETFLQISLRDIANDIDKNEEEMERLKSEGIDIVITGDLTHFYGYQSGNAGVSAAFGLVGVLTEAVANPKTIGAKVGYANIKVIDLHEKKILWQGDIDDTFEKKITFYDGPVAYALQALKGANDKLSMKLSFLFNTD